jgi:outer membrane protein, multidrug efflux system
MNRTASVRPLWRLSALSLAALLGACATLPAPPAPRLDSPGAFAAASPATTMAPSWDALDDPALSALLQQGLAANLDLQRAAERLQQARALAALQQQASRPSGGLVAAASAAQASGLSGSERRSQQHQLGLTLDWELDLFGRLRHLSDAAAARSRVSAADAQALRLAVAAEIAQAWTALNGAREQQRLAEHVVDNRQRMVALVLRRVGAGAAAALDESRARAELAAAQAALPLQQRAVAVATNRLAVLLGTSPSLYQPPAAPADAPRLITLPVPTPQRWLASRPDLVAAEAQLQAQAFDVRAHRAELLPRLSIGGMLGFIAGSVSGLGAAASAAWLVGPQLSLPLFDRGRIDARINAAQAGQREALLGYRQQLLLAVEELENGFVRVQQGQRSLAAWQQRAHHAIVAQDLARRRFEAGASDQLEWLDAERSASEAESGLAAALTDQRLQTITLLRALGTSPAAQG